MKFIANLSIYLDVKTAKCKQLIFCNLNQNKQLKEGLNHPYSITGLMGDLAQVITNLMIHQIIFVSILFYVASSSFAKGTI